MQSSNQSVPAFSPPPLNNASKLQQESEIRTNVDEFRLKVQKPAIGTTVIVYLILNIVMFIVGVSTTKDCPIKPIIPVYLAVAGALGIITKLLPVVNYKFFENVLIEKLVYALLIIEFVWMITGSVWIYSIYEPPYQETSNQLYCNKTAYLLAFWLLTLNYIFFLLFIIMSCCAVCCICASVMVFSD
ncbi:transmembrane protein 272-like [Photinus pyralis]|uniref:transmembrane protein 272-like n=1 Tax=Photinus pyralis TaxID=7054 RepID=UPI0012675137|nr:transmembrane protein 272-like [Photinus pyralis]